MSPRGHQDRGDGVPQPVKGHLRVASFGAQRGEPVAKAGGGQPGRVIGRSGEQPWPEPAAKFAALPPLRDGISPQVRSCRAEGEPADPAGFGRSDDLVRSAAGDGQHIPVQVADLQGGQFAAAGTGIGGQAGQQLYLLGAVQPCRGRPGRACLGDLPPGEAEDGADLLDGGVEPHTGMGRAAHAVEWVPVQNPFDGRPPQCRAQHPDPCPYRRVGLASLPPLPAR